MTTTHTAFKTLSDDDLLTAIKRLAAAERRVNAALVRALMEADARRLYLREGCASLFTWCTQVLGLDDGAAYNRIEVARAARRFPVLVEQLEDGSLTLTAARLLAPHLTPENHAGVLASARRQPKREIERIVAALNPRPDAPAIVRRLPARAKPGIEESLLKATESGEPAAPAAHPADRTVPASSPAVSPAPEPVARAFAAAPRPALTPLAPGRVKLQLTISDATHEKLRRAQDLLRHALPSGDLAAIVDRALTLLVTDLERRRFAATASPRTPRETAPGSRRIPAAVRRAVWTRDGGQCAFVGPHGRCRERGFLEFHHLEPYAAGGAATVDNLSLRCNRHNGYEASLFFGADRPGRVREAPAAYGGATGGTIDLR
jgi:hypothetical protein